MKRAIENKLRFFFFVLYELMEGEAKEYKSIETKLCCLREFFFSKLYGGELT